MDFYRPQNLADALEIKAIHPEAHCISGGTDLMVEINFDRKRPEGLIDLSNIPELQGWKDLGDSIEIGSGMPYTKICEELHEFLPGLAMAARTVGSPQIRNKGGVGGNLGSASPAGDSHPALLASGATVNVVNKSGSREIDINDFFVGPKRNALTPDELIKSIVIPKATGGQQYSKVGTRNAMVIAVCSFGVAIHTDTKSVGTGIGSAGPTPLRAKEAELYAAKHLDWQNFSTISDEVLKEFGQLVSRAAKPIDDVRGTAAYRRHSLAVIASRCLKWAWSDTQKRGQ